MACEGTLGCGSYRVVIADRCGSTVACVIEDQITDLAFSRVLDDTSEASINVKVTGDAGGEACCECLAEIRDWTHSLSVYRDGELVWGPGPIMNNVIGHDTATITARDVSQWLNRRVIRSPMTFTQVDIVQIALDLITHGMDPDDPCDVIGMVNATLGGVKIDKTYEGGGKVYVGDALRDLAKIGLDFTVIGATIVIAPNLEWGPLASLVDEDFLADIQVEERGEETATKWYVNGETVGGEAGGIDPIYGLIEQISSGDNDGGVEDTVAANTEAASRLVSSNPTPIYVNIPDGARLSPNAPVCFDQLVPGVLFDVYLRNICRPVGLRNRLTALKVTVNDSGESVGVTLAPLGTAETDKGTEEGGGTPNPDPVKSTTFSVATNNIMSNPKNPDVASTLAATPEASVVMVQEADIPEFKTALKNMTGYSTGSIPTGDGYGEFVMFKPDVWQHVSTRFIKAYDGVAGISKTRHIASTRLRNIATGKPFVFLSYHAVTAGNDPVRKRLRAQGDAAVQRELDRLAKVGVPYILGADLNRVSQVFSGYSISAKHLIDHILAWKGDTVSLHKNSDHTVATTSDHDALVMEILAKVTS